MTDIIIDSSYIITVEARTLFFERFDCCRSESLLSLVSSNESSLDSSLELMGIKEDDVLPDPPTLVAFFLFPKFRSVKDSSRSDISESFSSLKTCFDFFYRNQ